MTEQERIARAARLLAMDGRSYDQRLKAIGEIRRLLPLLEEQAVRDARFAHVSWASIALWMGLSHQAVIKRWRTRMHGDGYDPMSSRIRPDRLPPRGPAPPRIPLWNVR